MKSIFRDPSKIKILERIPRPPERDDDGGEMEEGVVETGIEFVADDEAPEVVQPADGPFDLPTLAIAPEFPAILRPGANPLLTVGTDKFDLALGEAFPQGIAVSRIIVDQPRGKSRDRGGIQQRLGEIHFRMVRRFDLNCQRKTGGLTRRICQSWVARYNAKGPTGRSPIYY